jgi:hypothetical protein
MKKSYVSLAIWSSWAAACADPSDEHSCDAEQVVMFRDTDWYPMLDGTHVEFPGESWQIETEFRGRLTEDVQEPPPPRRPARFWLDEIKVYAGNAATGDQLIVFLDQDVVVVGRTGLVCPRGETQFCVNEIIPATVRRACN